MGYDTAGAVVLEFDNVHGVTVRPDRRYVPVRGKAGPLKIVSVAYPVVTLEDVTGVRFPFDISSPTTG